jgi:hypothetical protein
MPIDKDTARKNLLNVIQYQLSHPDEYGQLLLALWYDIADQADDLYLFEVFEDFSTPHGDPVGTYRFPGMGFLWLPGVYTITACSRAYFEQAVKEADADVLTFRMQLENFSAELLYPFSGNTTPIVKLLRG